MGRLLLIEHQITSNVPTRGPEAPTPGNVNQHLTRIWVRLGFNAGSAAEPAQGVRTPIDSSLGRARPIGTSGSKKPPSFIATLDVTGAG